MTWMIAFQHAIESTGILFYAFYVCDGERVKSKFT